MFAVKLARTLLVIGQSQLAARAGISVRELARIENGQVTPRESAARSLDAALVGIVRDRAKDATKETT